MRVLAACSLGGMGHLAPLVTVARALERRGDEVMLLVPPEAVRGLIDRELFAERCTRCMLDAARELRDSWHPKLVVREPCEYASATTAREAGIAQAQVGISLAAIETVLGEPSYGRAAKAVASELAAQPALDEIVERLA